MAHYNFLATKKFDFQSNRAFATSYRFIRQMLNVSSKQYSLRKITPSIDSCEFVRKNNCAIEATQSN